MATSPGGNILIRVGEKSVLVPTEVVVVTCATTTRQPSRLLQWLEIEGDPDLLELALEDLS